MVVRRDSMGNNPTLSNPRLEPKLGSYLNPNKPSSEAHSGCIVPHK